MADRPELLKWNFALNMVLPVGTYTFYFALDPPDGQVTAEVLSSVEVRVQ